jgi:hypothetical protein
VHAKQVAEFCLITIDFVHGLSLKLDGDAMHLLSTLHGLMVRGLGHNYCHDCGHVSYTLHTRTYAVHRHISDIDYEN